MSKREKALVRWAQIGGVRAICLNEGWRRLVVDVGEQVSLELNQVRHGVVLNKGNELNVETGASPIHLGILVDQVC
jgi:hypothetical protein